MTDQEFMDALEQGEEYIPDAKVFISRAEYDKLVAQGALIEKLREKLEWTRMYFLGRVDAWTSIQETLALTPTDAAAQIRREVLEDAAKASDASARCFREKSYPMDDLIAEHFEDLANYIRGSVPFGQMVMSAAAISSTSEFPNVVEVVTVVDHEILEPTMSDDKTRNLVLRFWNLASSERREIALQLRLIEPEDIRLPEAERYGRAFQRAGKLGLLDRVAEEIQMRERT